MYKRQANDRPERVDLRSYARQGLDIIPTVHEGAAVRQMEKRGIQTNIGNLNREIKAANSLMPVSYTHLKEDLRLAAGMTTNMIANMSKEGKHISMDALARICETLNCEITDVIELVPDEPASTGGKEHERTETKNNGKRN